MIFSSAVSLGLAAAATWGAADFAGGLATRRAAPSRVVLIAHGVSFVLLAAASVAFPVHLSSTAIAIAVVSGIAGGAGLMVFYQALALGAMGLSAALAGLLTAALPVLLSLRSEGLPPTPQLVGFAAAGAAVLLIAYAPPAPGAHTPRRALLFSLLAGIGFGGQLLLLHAAAAGAVSPGPAVLQALAWSRLGGTAVALAAFLVQRRSIPLPAPPQRARLPLPVVAMLAGLLDTAGNGFYMVSSLQGRLDVAAVLSSLYPASTILLAALFLQERATKLQALGMGLALVAVGLIAA